MAKGLKARHAEADKALTAAQWGVYAFGTLDNVPWSECWARADDEARKAYESARNALEAIEREAIDKGRAWRSDNFNLLFWR